MRIIAGKFRGHQLVNFKADHIRPTSDRVKGSIFNKLQAEIEGARVLDLYAGTGNLSFEAISRGASFVLAVEKNRKSCEIVRQNVQKLKIAEDFELRMLDVFDFLKRYDEEPFDLIFIDPPFTEKISDATLEALCASSIFHDNTIIVIESTKHETVKDQYNDLIRFDVRDFGDKFVSYFQKIRS